MVCRFVLLSVRSVSKTVYDCLFKWYIDIVSAHVISFFISFHTSLYLPQWRYLFSFHDTFAFFLSITFSVTFSVSLSVTLSVSLFNRLQSFKAPSNLSIRPRICSTIQENVDFFSFGGFKAKGGKGAKSKKKRK